VILNNGIEAMLPEKDPEAALVQLVALDDESGLLNREIAAVDLRLSDRLVVRLTDRGETAWQAILKDRAKNAKRGKANT
jgi:cell division protein FtsQ